MIPVKICGITNATDARLAVKAGAAAIGFIFFKPSPRAITMERAQVIAANIPESVAKVGVFVNETVETVNKFAASVKLDFIQLHGKESPDYCARIERPVIKAFRIPRKFTERNFNQYSVWAVLLDSYRPGIPGGTGIPFNWNHLSSLPKGTPIILAGGLTPANVLAGIRIVKPAAIDVNSGVEVSPGRKDPIKVKALFGSVSSTAEYNNLFLIRKWKHDRKSKNFTCFSSR